MTHAAVVDRATVREAAPRLSIALIEIRFDTGTHETYQLVFAEHEGRLDLDALSDPGHVRELVHLIRAGITEQAGEGTIAFRPIEGFADLGRELIDARRVETEQSNTSIVFDEELILKAFRRLEAGINPELELLRFLTERGYENIAPLGGWYEYAGAPMDATLGVLQRYVRDGFDGWTLALDELESAPDRFLDRLHRLGVVTGELHTVLGSEAADPNFCPEQPSGEALGLLTATVDEEIERIFLALPAEEAIEPIAGRGEEVREQLRHLTQVGTVGRVIRHHGDYHLAQTLWSSEMDDWVILDFEGEPARPLHERRRKRSPFRDVAGMLRSFAYVVSAAEIQRGVVAPEGWEERARARFLEGYKDTVDPSLIPSGQATIDKLLAVFELEKAVYELRYELDNRPGWVRIPVAGIERMLREPVG